ncbi:thioredoxin family protein [Bhargavaea beijingensis]|uniref:Thioredoxin n=1 Tax=Bhargavaea beijingensis TaxID=426756 RepID=A0A1G7G7H4_9BACL|nr:thioredoxin family protein [Bhargavaea beijingensis]MCW1927422.1 thioredoxin family protein [Bhargavaea beijingensis]RSK30063.1 thioredoxin [Bhargavaea beijingensis]SDE84098.1 Thioredoxin [Bhargavaea beijingensis]
MKKLLIIGGAVIVVFALIVFLTNQSNQSKLENSPYGDKKLDQATIDQLDDENYQNIILPDELEKKIESGKAVTAYFFSPTCPHCQEMTPRLMPIAEDMGVQIDQLNLLEYEDGFIQYQIEATPTLIHFEDGVEVGRIVGAQPDENIEAFLNEYAK